MKRLNDAVSQAIDTKSVRDHLERLGVAIVPPERRSPEYLARFVRAEIEKWAVPIRAAGVAGQ